MSVSERDPKTGQITTGHEWNGIKELNTPVPKAVWFFLIVTTLFSIGYWIAMPAWPTGTSYTKGTLGKDDRTEIAAKVQAGNAERAVWMKKVEAEDYNQILNDPALMTDVRRDGARLFGDTCAACHGADAKGGKGFPNLTDKDWLWGTGTPANIEHTIAVGINSSNNPNTQVSQMTAFGKDGVLDTAAMTSVTDFVFSFQHPEVAQKKPNSVALGKNLFAANCASCHGPNATGDQTKGIPNLTDNIWIYGGDWHSIYTGVYEGHQGTMPAWEGRLSPADRKLLTVYLLDLGRNAK